MTSSATVLDSYLSWLRENTITYPEDSETGYAEIATPFLNHLRDGISIFAKFDQAANSYILSDGGGALAELSLAGVEINTPKRKDTLKRILRRYGVQLEDDQIIVKATTQNLASRKHNLLQAILASEELVHLSRASVSSIFWEDVAMFLNEIDVRFVSDIKLTGTSGFDYHFNFVIPKSQVESERILQAVSSPTKDRIQQLLWAWQDTRTARGEDSKLIVFLNDEGQIDRRIVESLQNYLAIPVYWSERQTIAPMLRA